MGFFNNLLQLATDVVVTPLAIAKDIVTFGEDNETENKLSDISKDIQKLIDNE